MILYLNYNSPPENLEQKDIVLEAHGAVIGPGRVDTIDRLICVVPSAYSKLPGRERYSVARLIGKIIRLSDLPDAGSIMLNANPYQQKAISWQSHCRLSITPLCCSTNGGMAQTAWLFRYCWFLFFSFSATLQKIGLRQPQKDTVKIRNK